MTIVSARPHDIVLEERMSGLTRRIVAIMAADIAGYSRLMEMSAEATHSQMMQLETEIIEPAIARYRGRVVKRTGDGFLASFDSAQDALDCALSIQGPIAERASAQPAPAPIYYRMGLNTAEVFVEKHDIYGEGVNTTARLQTHSEPGGIVVTAAFYEQVNGRHDLVAVDLGELHLKNSARPVHAYSLQLENCSHSTAIPNGFDSRPSIAVLPFRHSGAPGSDDYFSEGIIEGIIHVLAGLRDLFVISHGSTRGYAGSVVDPRKVGRELKVRYVLQGSLRCSATRLRILTELFDAETGAVLRSDQYEGELSDLFELQDRISAQVVTAIAPQVREHELRRAMRKHPDNLSSYDLLLQALDQLHRFDRESFARAGGLLRKAISDDPSYAPARSYAGWWHVLRVSQGWSSNTEADRAEAARQSAAAVHLDQSDHLALAIRGHSLAWRRDYHASLDELDRAIAVGPNSALAWTMRGLTLGFVGRANEAVQCGERALRLSPQDPLAFYHQCVLAQSYYIAGRIEESISLGHLVTARCGPLACNLRLLTVALAAVGRLGEARRMAAQVLADEPGFCLSAFAARTPLPPAIREDFVTRLRAAGVPE